MNKQYVYLNALLAKDDFKDDDLSKLLTENANFTAHDLHVNSGLNGKLFVKNSTLNRPRWAAFAESAIGQGLPHLLSRSTAAVLVIKVDKKVFAYTFGYGRSLLDQKHFVPDFGIKTALNTLKHDSLRSVDLYTLEDQAVQKKAQAVRESDIGIFGIDVSRDVLRAVTGSARDGVKYKNITGGGSVFSFGVEASPTDLNETSRNIRSQYLLPDYKKNFLWVDNIRRLKDKSKLAELDQKLVDIVKAKDATQLTVTVPEVIPWDRIHGFSFTRSKTKIKPELLADDYFSNVDPLAVSIESLKSDRLFIHDVEGHCNDQPIYKCFYLEIKDAKKTFVMFAGEWYEIDNDFKARIEKTLDNVLPATIPFSAVHTWQENGKDMIENEGDYNSRIANQHGYCLLDKKLVKCDKTTTPIELCDLLSPNGHFIHVKHRKGGSAGLSHLFSQGNVAAEVMLGDREFRYKARKVIRAQDPAFCTQLPLDGFKSSSAEIVFAILGDTHAQVKSNLPFFSKVNLARVYDDLAGRNYRVSIAGIPKVARP